ncbi:hypothetical protein CR205_04635 [Alteribacter lacisalsi]|uniref:Uncharacterized protein n=1 Tax=Alteribacter lacisalsi TaxID=2045244 RepID=A0A2W0HK54_9BACI|nr:hypothetical protein CR205_04635 [Alteribacter lacisalsi]
MLFPQECRALASINNKKISTLSFNRAFMLINLVFSGKIAVIAPHTLVKGSTIYAKTAIDLYYIKKAGEQIEQRI